MAHESVQAVKWFRQAAEQNLPAAQSNLGVCYERGDGVPKYELEAYNEVSWGRPDSHWSSLCLERCPATPNLAKTNVQTQIVQWAGSSARVQMQIAKAVSPKNKSRFIRGWVPRR